MTRFLKCEEFVFAFRIGPAKGGAASALWIGFPDLLLPNWDNVVHGRLSAVEEEAFQEMRMLLLRSQVLSRATLWSQRLMNKLADLGNPVEQEKTLTTILHVCR